MSKHIATVSWSSDGQFTSGRYSRAHDWQFDGGAMVRGSASPGAVAPPMSDSAAVDPEEALVASASSCHMLWFLSLAQGAGYEVAAYRDEAEGRMGRDERGRIGFTGITLRPAISFAGTGPDAEALARLHRQAHDKCFIANSLRCAIAVEPAPAPAPERQA